MSSSESESIETPHVDPKSKWGHLKVGRAYLEQRFGGRRSEILRRNLIGESPSRQYFWFADELEVRRELGMEEN